MQKLLYPSLQEGLVGAWCPSVDNSRSTILTDFSPYKNNGVLTLMDPGTDWVASDGKVALDFDGSNDYVSTPIVWPNNNNTGVTFSFWTKVNSADSGQTGSAMGFGANGFPRLQMHCPYSGNIYWDAGNTSTGRISAGMAGYYDMWVHVCGTSSLSEQALRVNNKVLVSQAAGIALNAIDSQPLTLGSWSGFLHKGQIDDIRIYNRALTPSEISILAQRRGIAYETRRVPVVRGAAVAAVEYSPNIIHSQSVTRSASY